MERLSIGSARAAGHQVTVFSHDPNVLRRGALECEVQHADDRLPPPLALNFAACTHLTTPITYGSSSAVLLGAWIDLDLVFLRQLPPHRFLMGWENEDLFAMLFSDCPRQRDPRRVHHDLRQVTVASQCSLVPVTGKDQRREWVTQCRGKMVRCCRPGAPHLVHKHRLTGHVKQRRVFSNSRLHTAAKMWREWPSPGIFERHIEPETATVHLWRSMFRRCSATRYLQIGSASRFRACSKIRVAGSIRSALLGIVQMPAARRGQRLPLPS